MSHRGDAVTALALYVKPVYYKLGRVMLLKLAVAAALSAGYCGRERQVFHELSTFPEAGRWLLASQSCRGKPSSV